MTQHPDWIEPRHSAAMTDRFCDALTEGVDRRMYFGLAHKVQKAIDYARPDNFDWVHQAWLPGEIRHLDQRIAAEACDPYFRRFNLRSPEYPIETMVHLVVCDEVPITDPHGAVRGGKVTDIAAVLGLFVDIDVALRRRGDARFDRDDRPYIPTFGAALDLLGNPAPTLAIDGGGGLIAVWLLDAPHSEISDAHALGADLRETVHDRWASHGWGFDSPESLTGWVKVPGTWSAKYGRVVTALDVAGRWPFADLRAAVAHYEHHDVSPFYKPDASTWDGRPIPRPEDSGQPIRQHSARRQRGTRRGKRS